jgi:hypothetical protein
MPGKLSIIDTLGEASLPLPPAGRPAQRLRDL